ncbi:hypothetical protein EDD22DRAFT_960503 [Suillus occidentalis]|nr:hypothetical protein EDD22DRAFT_960503 [Suillus occidentalis]
MPHYLTTTIAFVLCTLVKITSAQLSAATCLLFQLQECLTHAKATIATNTPLADDPPDEEEYELDKNTRTFFGAEGVGSVKQFIKEVYAGKDSIKPNHTFFNNNCTLTKLAKGDPFFDNIGLSVDENCNPEAFPELHSDDGKGWRFNSSVAEQTNNWFGKYHPIAWEMLAHKFNFFCDELVLWRNHRMEQKLGKDGHEPRTWPYQQVCK